MKLRITPPEQLKSYSVHRGNFTNIDTFEAAARQ